MQAGRDRACAQVFGRGAVAGLLGAMLCFTAGAASAQESTKTSTQAATKASAQAAAKAATRAATKASTKASAQASTKASTKVSAQAATKASAQAATKASAQAATKASAQASTKVSAQAATKASAQESAKASTKAATKASAQASAKASVKASTKASTKASAQAATKASAQASAKASTQATKASAQESAKASTKAATQASSQASAKASPQDASAQLPLKLSGSQLEPVKWTELAGWTADDHLAAFAAYRESCRAARKTPRSDDHAAISAALWNVCRDAMGLRPQDADTARAFFERNFQPVRIARLGEAAGLLTGYFEPVVAGSRFPSPEFHVPVYRRPRDLVAVGYKPASVAFPNKGARIARRTANNELVPYHDRGAIEAGALDGQKLEICWLKDPFDLLTMQIEGSARVILEDGTPLRISYDSHNGYRYGSIERVLVERNLISRQEMSAQRIR